MKVMNFYESISRVAIIQAGVTFTRRCTLTWKVPQDDPQRAQDLRTRADDWLRIYLAYGPNLKPDPELFLQRFSTSAAVLFQQDFHSVTISDGLGNEMAALREESE